MKTNPFTLTFSLILGCLITTAATADEVATEGAEVGKWTMDYDAAVKLATEKKVPIMMNFTGSDWCGWCKLMDKTVFAGEEWKSFAAENVVLVTIDFPQDKSIVPEKFVGQNEELKNKFGVRGYPTYVVLDSDGETKIGQLGAGKGKTPESFVKEFKRVVLTSPAGIEAYAKANPEKADAFKAAIQELEGVKQELDDWIATKPQRNEENTKIFEGFKERIEAASAKLDEFE
ncbi:MAG: thioredoxin family protein [Verrucomicrobiales bacterium]|nr:thioredoxin family protein [Verrucomicrobiales bacterium]